MLGPENGVEDICSASIDIVVCTSGVRVLDKPVNAMLGLPSEGVAGIGELPL